MQTFDIGQCCSDYYQNKGFVVLPSSSLLDPNIPTTFVMSAGLTQIETTLDQSKEHAGERYVLLQTCFRHFDLDKIGRSATHLSLFGMGGIFYFGAENRVQLLSTLWGFLTKELGLAPDRFVATYFAGDTVDGYEFEADPSTARVWRQIGLLPSQIVGVGADGGFWKQGDGISGKDRFRKCGPATELFWDLGPELGCGSSCNPGCACGRFVEVANILFIHSLFDQVTRSVNPLVTPFDEAVIGIERIAMVLQGQPSVFDIDCIAPLVRHVHLASRAVSSRSESRLVQSARIVADHIRSLVFLIADGAPAPTKRWGRPRIIRDLIRATVTRQKVLGIASEDFVPDMVELVLSLYQSQYPYLAHGYERVLAYFAKEQERFEKTLASGYRKIDRLIRRNGTGIFDGVQALELVKHYGIPFVLLEIELTKRNIQLDRQEYRLAYARWREAEVYSVSST